ncbi:DUF6348 family protein [Sandaracinus amylolyticus]|uniref:DUF6348 family protein n=1 Tax=Sandaracinus amylolyticus TaxID=927083 RepID=UPI001F26E9C6|nr:DUF6348 family protein [Sandaracinus amylolyticus]UJR79507.1 Hypothetical protein I5071_15430 [Sandaracinus amylolyticus]
MHATLTAAGVSSELALELLAFVPLAFGRHLLARTGAKPGPTYRPHAREGVGPHAFPIDDEPLYRAAYDRASYSDRDRHWKVARWSAEVDASSAAGRTGKGPEDLVESVVLLWLPHLMTIGPDARARVLRERKDVDVYGLNAMLARSLVGHGVRARFDGARAIADSGEVWEAIVFPRVVEPAYCAIQVDFLVRSPRLAAPHRVNESFVGEGPDMRAAVAQAFEKLSRASFHPILAVLHDHDDETQVSWEHWHGPHGCWRVCLGPVLHLWSPQTQTDLAPLLDWIETRVRETSLTREVHWVRVFRAQRDAPMISEALLDNETWPALQDDVARWELPPRDDAYALRLFLMLVPESH